MFSILGPHNDMHYGCVAIILKQDILYHPDTNFTPMAGTSFLSGRQAARRWWYVDNSKKIRPKIHRTNGSSTPGQDLFHQSKLHCSVDDWSVPLSLDLFARNGATLDVIKQNWLSVDSHFVTEGKSLDLSYVANVCISPPTCPIFT